MVDLGQGDTAPDFSGIIGLTAFERTRVTVDAVSSTITFGQRDEDSDWVPLDLRTNGPSTDPFAELTLPSGRVITVEVDTGSGCLILDSAWLEQGDVEVSGELETRAGTDETGHQWLRRRGMLKGAVPLGSAVGTRQTSPTVIFQEIIHDGLIGADYLDRFVYTVDVANARLGLSARP